jgi:triosephosphate isomerase
MHWAADGAHTGEISAAMLLASGCTYVILGHSERRQAGESDEMVHRKLVAALDAGLRPIVCVGETLAEREAGRIEEVVLGQVGGALGDLDGDAVAAMVLAYEPVWAIGTGATATAAQAEEVHALIRDFLAERLGAETAAALRIQYGGSVKPENAAELFAQENIDGGLIGGAALAAESFAAIVKAAL